jgi:hypothetical protein
MMLPTIGARLVWLRAPAVRSRKAGAIPDAVLAETSQVFSETRNESDLSQAAFIRSSESPMSKESLDTYLNDHLAGSIGALEFFPFISTDAPPRDIP